MYIYTLSRSHTREHQNPETSSADRISCPLHHDRCVPAVRQIHIHVYTNTHAHTHTHTYAPHTHKNKHTQKFTHSLSFAHTHTHTLARAHAHMFVSTASHIFTYAAFFQGSSVQEASFGTAKHCNTLQHTATHCNTLQHNFNKIGLFLYRVPAMSRLPHSMLIVL